MRRIKGQNEVRDEVRDKVRDMIHMAVIDGHGIRGVRTLVWYLRMSKLANIQEVHTPSGVLILLGNPYEPVAYLEGDGAWIYKDFAWREVMPVEV